MSRYGGLVDNLTEGVLLSEEVLRLTEDLDAPTLLVRRTDDCEEVGVVW
jgi:hypothetical protein